MKKTLLVFALVALLTFPVLAKGQKITIKRCSVWLCNNSIHVILPKDKSFWDETASDAYKQFRVYVG